MRQSRPFRRSHGGIVVFMVLTCLLALLSMTFQDHRRLQMELKQTQEEQSSWETLLQKMDMGLKEKDSALRDKDAELNGRLAELRDMVAKLREKDAELRDKDKELRERDSQVQEKTEALQQAVDRQAELGRNGNVVFEDAKADLYADSLVLRHYLRTNAVQLEATWQAQLSKHQQRGVVISAGHTKSLANAFTTLHVMRHHLNSSLPSTIMYWGAHPDDNISATLMASFKDHLSDVDFLDASKLPYPEYQHSLLPEKRDGSFSGFKVKAFSIYAAPFKEVLFIDADNIPLIDPSCLFETDQYEKHGNLFWPDFWSRLFAPWESLQKQWFPERLYDTLKLDNPWAATDSAMIRQTESGQLVLDRSRHREVLEWMLFLNTHDDVTYHLMHGDKDTFRAAFYLAGIPQAFQQVSHFPSITMTALAPKGILQLHPNGTAMFHHHNYQKFEINGSRPAITRVSAPASEELAIPLLSSRWKKEQALLVNSEQCNFTLWDWPGTQHSCSPSYNQNLLGAPQQLPVYDVPYGSFLAVAMSEAGNALAKFRQIIVSEKA